MNIKLRCPCGESIEVTHLTTRPDRAADQIGIAEKEILRPWRRRHKAHHVDALEAHIGNIERRRSPVILLGDCICPPEADEPDPECPRHRVGAVRDLVDP